MSDVQMDPASSPAKALPRAAWKYLSAASRALASYRTERDPEAMHQFRVAVRQLRSHLRAYKQEFPVTIPGALRRTLGGVADATNPSRDATVQLELLDTILGKLAKGKKSNGREFRAGHAGLSRLRAVLADAAGGGGAGSTAFSDEWEAISAELAALLRPVGNVGSGGKSVPKAVPTTTGECAAAVIKAHRDELWRHMEHVGEHGFADAPAVHQTRIAAKRVRYLLSPFSRVHRSVRMAESRMKSLQDTLGDWRDLELLGIAVRQIRDGGGGVSEEGPEGGQIGVIGMVLDEINRKMRRIEREYQKRWSLAEAKGSLKPVEDACVALCRKTKA